MAKIILFLEYNKTKNLQDISSIRIYENVFAEEAHKAFMCCTFQNVTFNRT